MTFTDLQTYVIMNCGTTGCGMSFGVPTWFYNLCKEKGRDWYCPNGHNRIFVESDIDRLQRELSIQKNSTEFWRTDSRKNERRLSATRGVLTKVKNRIANGICPCCRRSFSNLARHMKHLHPNYLNKDS